MLPESAIAQGFHRVQYGYHRDFFKLLGYEAVVAQFGAIWELCEPHMGDEPHEPRVLNQEPSYWLPHLEHPKVRKRFLDSLCHVLEREADGDEARGRMVLAGKLRGVVATLREMDRGERNADT